MCYKDEGQFPFDLLLTIHVVYLMHYLFRSSIFVNNSWDSIHMIGPKYFTLDFLVQTFIYRPRRFTFCTIHIHVVYRLEYHYYHYVITPGSGLP